MFSVTDPVSDLTLPTVFPSIYRFNKVNCLLAIQGVRHYYTQHFSKTDFTHPPLKFLNFFSPFSDTVFSRLGVFIIVRSSVFFFFFVFFIVRGFRLYRLLESFPLSE